MTIYRFRVDDDHNPWAKAVEIEAADLPEAERRAGHWLFARRDVGAGVTLTPEDPAPEASHPQEMPNDG